MIKPQVKLNFRKVISEKKFLEEVESDFRSEISSDDSEEDLMLKKKKKKKKRIRW